MATATVAQQLQPFVAATTCTYTYVDMFAIPPLSWCSRTLLLQLPRGGLAAHGSSRLRAARTLTSSTTATIHPTTAHDRRREDANAAVSFEEVLTTSRSSQLPVSSSLESERFAGLSHGWERVRLGWMATGDPEAGLKPDADIAAFAATVVAAKRVRKRRFVRVNSKSILSVMRDPASSSFAFTKPLPVRRRWLLSTTSPLY